MNSLFLKYNFTLSSSFKTRSKLASFYKYIHPDVLGNAPEKVKEENTRSLKLLNAHLDSVTQNQSAKGQQIQFFLPEKDNQKSKKFFPFTVNLVAFQGNSQDLQIRDHVDGLAQKILICKQRLYKTLLNTVSLMKNESNPMKKRENDKKIEFFKVQPSKQKYEQIKSETLQEMGRVKKEKDQHLQKRQSEQMLQFEIFGVTSKHYEKNLKDTLKQHMFQQNFSNTKQRVWSELLYKEIDHFPGIVGIMSRIIDPRLIYFDPVLTNRQVDAFKNRLIPKTNNENEEKLMNKTFSDMEASNPQIYLYVTKEYSGKLIPGYFGVPYNFKPRELLGQYQMLKETVVQEKEDFDKNYNEYEKLVQNILKEFDLFALSVRKVNKTLKKSYILQQIIRNTSDIQDLKICILKLKSVLQILFQSEEINLKYIFQNYKTIIEENQENLKFTGSTLHIPLNFDIEELKQTIRKTILCI